MVRRVRGDGKLRVEGERPGQEPRRQTVDIKVREGRPDKGSGRRWSSES